MKAEGATTSRPRPARTARLRLRLALEAANIIPIFCVAGGNDLAYQGLVTALGRGTEVTLTSNSSNVVATITAGMSVVTTTRVENAWGGAGNDSLDGGAGNDSMTGGFGHDAYVVGGAGDVVVEGVGEGTETVDAAMDYTLGANLNALVLGGTAHSGTGYELDNSITGNDLGDILAGGAGLDTLTMR